MFRNDVLKSSETMADQMAKTTSPEQIDQLVRNHINRLKAVEELAEEDRRRQMNQLQEALAVRRRKALGDLQQAQTEQVSYVVKTFNDYEVTKLAILLLDIVSCKYFYVASYMLIKSSYTLLTGQK